MDEEERSEEAAVQRAIKREQDFFNYYLFVHLPLRLSRSQRPLSDWAQSQDKADKNTVLLSENMLASIS